MSRGASVVEYIGAITAVGLMMLSLLAVKQYVVRGRDPVGAVPYVVRILGDQTKALDPPKKVVPARPRKPAKRRPRPPKPRVIVEIPEWWMRR
jgi:hypothetical protein